MKRTSWLAFSIDRSSKTPVFEQICEAIRQRAISGALAEGAKLPPTREFAMELGVSRSTVVTTYEQLVAEGYLISRAGSGYTVCAIGEVELSKQKNPSKTMELKEDTTTPIPFEASQPDMRLFPHRQWAKAIARICRTNPESMLVGGSVFGNLDLRKSIASHVSEWRGIEASPHQIIITAGSTDGLEVCMRALSNKGDIIGLEDPGYMPAHHLAEMYGLSPKFLNIGDHGAGLPSSRTVPSLVVLTPSHQYPMGGAMSPNRRHEFIRWAEKEKAWIIEDDYDSEFRYAGRPIPAMAGFDRLNRTIYIGSFSKIFSNSLRLGYVIVPDSLLELFRTTMKRFGLKASYLPQQALAEFMKSGEFYRHLRRVRRIYGERRKFLLGRLNRDFSEFGNIQDHQAGMQFVLHLKDKFTDVDLSRLASDIGITLDPLSSFSTNKTKYNGLVFGFCGFDEKKMDDALRELKFQFMKD